jgi:hypothetical protein
MVGTLPAGSGLRIDTGEDRAMSWQRLSDRHHESDKIDPLSHEAYRLWSMIGAWASQAENWWRHGFIPLPSLPTISRGKWSPRKLDRLLNELVASRGSGKSGMGLLEPRDGGWQIHDWQQYEPPEPKNSQNKSASLAGKRSAEVRKSLYGTAQPNKHVEHHSNTFDNRSGERRPERLSNVVEPLDLDLKSNINLRSEDLTGSRVRPAAEAEREATKTEETQATQPKALAPLVLVPPGGVAGVLATVSGGLRRIPPPSDSRPLARRPVTAAELDAALETLPRGAVLGHT